MMPSPWIKPMEPIPCQKLIEEKRFIYQVKWDGVRMLAFVSNHHVRLWNRKQHERSEQYPEMKQLSNCIRADSCVLDGEMVVMRNQRPHFPSIMQRDNCQTAPRIAALSRLLPVYYVIFDLLQVDDENLTGYPLLERRTRLNTLLDINKCPGCHLIEDFSKGKSLFEAVQSANLEGIVMKALDSTYHPGRTHQAWFKIKCRRQIQCIVGGYLTVQRRPRSLLLGINQNGILQYVGKASTGLKEDDWMMLMDELKSWEVRLNPFNNTLAVNSSGDMHFVKPLLGVDIEFQEWTDHMQLRSPVIRGFFIIGPEKSDVAGLETTIGQPGNGGSYG